MSTSAPGVPPAADQSPQDLSQNQSLLEGRNLLWFAQLAGDWNPRDLRDGGGFAELMAAMIRLGAGMGDIWFNHKPREEDPAETFQRLTSKDVIVLPTRPPLHDKGEGQPRRHLRPSSTALERAIHAPFHVLFRRCARNSVALADEPAKMLDGEKKNRRTTTYYQYTRNGLEVTWAFYKTLEGRKPTAARDRTTAVFLVWVPQLWQGGPALLSAFGMGANETLLWCHLLRTRMNHLLIDVLKSPVPRFIMCELTTATTWTSEPLRAPLDLLTLSAAAAHWQVEPAIDYTPPAWTPPEAETFFPTPPRPAPGPVRPNNRH
ncbi:MAG TPA: hypothetical protein VGG33_27840 [Polyangia bacterium]